MSVMFGESAVQSAPFKASTDNISQKHQTQNDKTTETPTPTLISTPTLTPNTAVKTSTNTAPTDTSVTAATAATSATTTATTTTISTAIATATEDKQPKKQPPKNEQTLSEGWKKWRRISGSAQSSLKKLSSVDPLVTKDQVQKGTAREDEERESLLNSTNEAIDEQTIRSNETTSHKDLQASPEPASYTPAPPASAQKSNSWFSYMNPLNYIPLDPLHFSNINDALPLESRITEETQSNLSLSTGHSTLNQPASNNGWLAWLIPLHKHAVDAEIAHDQINQSSEVKKTIKEVKKAIQNQDTVWVWYQNRYNINSKFGEVSVLGTRMESNPVELPKFPHVPNEVANNSTNNGYNNNAELPDDDLGTGEVIPSFNENLRRITKITKIRIATELYYNIPTQKHLYIKNSTESPNIQHTLIIVVTAQPKGKYSLTSNHIAEIATEALRSWFFSADVSYDYQIETIGLEAGRLTADSLEDLFKLVTNWSEDFKKIQNVLVVGYKNTAPLSFALLDLLISRNLLTNCVKLGVLNFDALMPSPYMTNQLEQNMVSYMKLEDFEKSFSKLVGEHNVKVIFIGTCNNLAVSLALHLLHPNIFRLIYLPKSKYNDVFEKQLFKLLLTSSNLGIGSTRLLLQIARYFTPNVPVTMHEDLNRQFFSGAMDFILKTTSLFHKKAVERHVIDDPILTNDYNLIWTFHAFIDEFKKIKNINSVENIKDLLRSYAVWDPHSKSLKELKYMLEVLKIEDYSGTIFTD